ATTATHLQNGHRPSQLPSVENSRKKIVCAASAYSSRRPAPSTRATTARTSGVNLRASSSPAARSPSRNALTRPAQSSGGQSHSNIVRPWTGDRQHARGRLAAAQQHQRHVVLLRPQRQRLLQPGAEVVEERAAAGTAVGERLGAAEVLQLI